MRNYLTTAPLVFVISLAAFGEAQAQQPSISYDAFAAGITKTDLDGVQFTSFSVGTTFSLSDSFFVAGSFGAGESDEKYRGNALNLDGYSFGLGYHSPINSTTDLVTSLNYSSVEAEFAGAVDESDGIGVDIGVRSFLTQDFEVGAFLEYSDSGNSDGEVSFSINGKYFITETFAVVAAYETGDDYNSISASLRFNF